MLAVLDSPDTDFKRENTCSTHTSCKSVRQNTYRTRMGLIFSPEKASKRLLCAPDPSLQTAPLKPPRRAKLEKFAAFSFSTLPKLETYTVLSVFKPADARQVAFTCPTPKATLYGKNAYKTPMSNKNTSMFSSLAFSHLSFSHVKSRTECRSLREMFCRLENSDREFIRKTRVRRLRTSNPYG